MTLEPAAARVLEQMPALKQYFLKTLVKLEEKKPPKERLTEKKAYLNIRKHLKSSTLIAELQFVISSAHVFTAFTGMFQTREPLIHILYSELERLALTLLGRVCKKEAVQKLGITESVLDLLNLSPFEEIGENYGDDVSAELKKVISIFTSFPLELFYRAITYLVFFIVYS